MEGTRIALALPAPPIINRNSAKAAVGSRQQTQIAADSFSQRGLLSREVSTRSLRSLLGLVLAKELAQTRSLWSLLSHDLRQLYNFAPDFASSAGSRAHRSSRAAQALCRLPIMIMEALIMEAF